MNRFRWWSAAFCGSAATERVDKRHDEAGARIGRASSTTRWQATSHKEHVGYPSKRTRVRGWSVRWRAASVRGRLVSSRRGSRLTRTAWTIWSVAAVAAAIRLTGLRSGVPFDRGSMTRPVFDLDRRIDLA